jgi:plastocyanin
MSPRPLLILAILVTILIGAVIGLHILLQSHTTADIVIPPKDVPDWTKAFAEQNKQAENTEPKQNAWSVSIGDAAFDPPDAAVDVGSTITWINNGSEQHLVSADDGQFNSGVLNPGESFTVAFDRPGRVTYHCMVHPSMAGSVTVGREGEDT